MKRLISILALTATFFAFTTNAEARSHRATHKVSHYRVAHLPTGGSGCDFSNDGRQQCQIGAPAYAVPSQAQTRRIRTVSRRGNNESGDSPAASMVSSGYYPTHRPPGAHHAWCGDGTSIAVFGRMVPGLALASNWGRFQSAAPGPGMVAYRSGHVKLITGYSGGGYTCYDPNSGGGVAHSGPCSLSGYRIVNPHASRYAKL